MKLLSFNKKQPYAGKLKYPINKRIKGLLVKIVIINALVFALAPGIFYGAYGIIGGIVRGSAEARKQYHIRAKYGRTALELYQCADVWRDLGRSLKNFEFIK